MGKLTVINRDSIAIVTIDNPPVNALSQTVRQELMEAVVRTEADQNIRATVLNCAGRTFIAGADVREFGRPPMLPNLPDVVECLERARKPWIAAIHGHALGGGLEVALGCQHRIADKSAKLGLPEVLLGLIPGAGGTVRLPRLIGAEAALEMIASGKSVSANKALSLGLLDRVSGENLLQEAVNFAKEVSALGARVPIIELPRPSIVDIQSWTKEIAKKRNKARGQKSILAAINAAENAVNLTSDQALDSERKTFLSLKNDPQSSALRHIFFAERSVSKMERLKDVKPRALQQIGVVGGGTMGAGISVACLLAGLSVVMVERDNDSVNKGLETVGDMLAKSYARGLIDAAALKKMKTAISGATDYNALSQADMVIEAVFEDMAVKKDVFIRLDAVTRPDAVLATNTSYLDVGEIASVVTDPSRVFGLHFFSPAHIMKLLEIVHPPEVANDILATGFALARRLHKIAVPVGVCDGFVGNRIMSAYRRECDYMLEDGALPQDIDAAMLKFGFPMGIFAMQDMAGLDIAWAMRKRQADTRPKDFRYVDIPDRLCEMGRLGRKTGLGWYDYSNGPVGQPDPIVEQLIMDEAARKGISRKEICSEEIITRILSVMQCEGARILDEGIAAGASAIDVVMVNGYGFPRWKGGPMYMAENSGQ